MRLIWWMTAVTFFHPAVYASVANEVRPGLIELRSETKGGLAIQSVKVRTVKNKTWLYFCVEESGSRRKGSCFYARQAKFPGLKTGRSLDRLRYALSPRIYNRGGRIAVGDKRYFYPVHSIQALDP